MTVQKILYKYVTAARFKKLWNSETIRFTQLDQLNDPYENRILDNMLDLDTPTLKKLANGDIKLFEAFLTAELHTAKNHYKKLQNEFDTKFGILSLTENPLNLRMWSHYADEHKGVVIGIDVSDSIFHENGVIINPEQGHIKYDQIKPLGLKAIKNITYTSDEDGGYTRATDLDNAISVELVFLYKALDWEYEKEVRIVRDFNVNAGAAAAPDKQNIRLFSLPRRVIKQVIFGVRHDEKLLEDFLEKNKKSNIPFSQIALDDTEYKMIMKPLICKTNSTFPKSLPNKPIQGQMIKGNNNSKKKKPRH